MEINVQEYIDKDKSARDQMILSIRRMLNIESLCAYPKLSYPYYGYNLSNTTIARYKPWEENKKEYRTLLGKEALYNIRQMNDIAPKGIAYELGTYEGGVARMLIDEGRKVKVFDTFEGIKGSGEGDIFKNGNLKTDFNMVSEYIKEAEIINGDILDTLKDNLDEEISFVHMDMDVKYPTEYSLKTIWNNIKSGGIIVLDDYGTWLTQGIKQAVDEFKKGKKIYFPTGQIAIIKE